MSPLEELIFESVQFLQTRERKEPHTLFELTQTTHMSCQEERTENETCGTSIFSECKTQNGSQNNRKAGYTETAKQNYTGSCITKASKIATQFAEVNLHLLYLHL